MVIIYTSSRRAVLRRFATLLIAPQRFVCYNATNSAPHGPSRHRVNALRRTSLRNSAQLNDLFVTTLRGLWHCCTPRLSATHCSAPLRNSTICLLLRSATLLASPRRHAPLRSVPRLNDLFVTTQPNATRLASTRRGSTQLNDLFVTTTTRLVATRRLSTCRIFMQRPAIQRNELKL